MIFKSVSELRGETFHNLDITKIDSLNFGDAPNLIMLLARQSELKTVGSIDVYNVNDARNMFIGCKSLESVEIKTFSTGKSFNASRMFSGCVSLRNLDLRNIQFNATTAHMYNMFEGCVSLESLELFKTPTFHTDSFSYVFKNCKSLKKLDLSSFHPTITYDMCETFLDCENLQYLDISGFNLQDRVYIRSPFSGCTALKRVVLGSGCRSLEEYLPEGVEIIYDRRN